MGNSLSTRRSTRRRLSAVEMMTVSPAGRSDGLELSGDWADLSASELETSSQALCEYWGFVLGCYGCDGMLLMFCRAVMACCSVGL